MDYDTKQRVCHVTSVHPANDVRIFYKECLSLAKHYDVFLIAPNIADDECQGIHRRGVSLPQSRIKKLFCLNRVYQKALAINASVYHFHDPELIPIGRKLKRKGYRVIFDSHEDVPMQILTKEYLPTWGKKPLSAIYSVWERKHLAHYDALVTVTPTILDRLKRINSNTVMVTNYPPFEEIPHDYNKKETPIVCFAGGVDERYMHHVIINSLSKTPCRYLLAGRCFIPSYMERLQALPAWEKVDYLGVLSPDKVSEIYQKADIGLVLLDYSPNVGYHKGTLGVLKMFEYMMAGIPVIATDFDLWKEIIEHYDCGICVNPHDEGAIADAINYFVQNPDIAHQKGQNGLRAVREQYNWATQEQNLFNLYSQLSNTEY